MVRYDNRYTFRMNQDLKNTLKKFCEDYRLKESEFVRNSVEKCLVNEMQNRGKTPEFNSIFATA